MDIKKDIVNQEKLMTKTCKDFMVKTENTKKKLNTFKMSLGSWQYCTNN